MVFRGISNYLKIPNYVEYEWNLHDRGLTSNMVRANGMACMSVTSKIGNIKKFFCLPLNAKVVFGLEKEELLQSKSNSNVKDFTITFFAD